MRSFISFITHFITPTHNNNYRARLLHIDFLSLFLFVALFLAITTNSYTRNILGIATDISVDSLLSLTNQKRIENGLNPLSLNESLCDAARRKALNMFEKGYWNHFGPNGESPWLFISQAGYDYSEAGENLAKNFNTSAEVVQAWMDSPSHKENILTPSYTDIGFAVVNGNLNGEETTLVVQLFAKPSSSFKTNFIAKAKETEKNIKSDYPTIFPTTTKPEAKKPTAMQEKKTASTTILSQGTNKGFIGYISFSQKATIIFISFIILALFFDLYFACKYNVIRLTGKNIAHLAIVIIILASLFMIKRGAIM